MSLRELLFRDHGSALQRIQLTVERYRQIKSAVSEYESETLDGTVMPPGENSRYINNVDELQRVKRQLEDLSSHLQAALADGLRSGRYTTSGRIGSWDAPRSAINQDHWLAVRKFDFSRSSAGEALDAQGQPLGFWIYGIEVEPTAAVAAAPPAKTATAVRAGPRRRGGEISAAVEALLARGPLPVLKKKRNALINQWLKENGQEGVSDRTIRRHFNEDAFDDGEERTDRSGA